MTKINLFVTGMFRSGTTLLARMLNAHPSICFASDPYAPIFKCFRNEVAVRYFESSFDISTPLDDYYFDEFQNDLFNKIQSLTFELPLQLHNIHYIAEKIRNHCEPYSPKIISFLSQLSGEYYSEIFQSGMNIVEQAYGNETSKVIGFKEVWTNEFTPHFLQNFSNSKVIIIERDPRAVVASNYATKTHRYPFLFLCRQWRKLATLGYYYNKKYKNVMLLNFEDLIRNPTIHAKNICYFLGIEYDENLIQPSMFLDVSGGEWTQNSTYKTRKNNFNMTALKKWKQVLNNEQIHFIELLCSFEMKLFNYEISIKNNNMNVLDNKYPLNNEGLAEWIKSYRNYNIADEKKNELRRITSIVGDDILMPNDKKRLFLIDDINN